MSEEVGAGDGVEVSKMEGQVDQGRNGELHSVVVEQECVEGDMKTYICNDCSSFFGLV